MKKGLVVLILSLFMNISFAQIGFNIGVKAGVNFANLYNTSTLSTTQYNGYMIGGYIAPKRKKFFGYRSELILSRQGYDYQTNTNTGNVNLDYLLIPQLLTLNFTKRIQIQVGGQAAFLLNTGIDSTGDGSNGSLFDYFKRFDFGVVGGGEIVPFAGFFLGSRINISLNNVSFGGTRPNYIPGVNAKNNVVQVYTGWRF